MSTSHATGPRGPARPHRRPLPGPVVIPKPVRAPRKPTAVLAYLVAHTLAGPAVVTVRAPMPEEQRKALAALDQEGRVVSWHQTLPEALGALSEVQARYPEDPKPWRQPRERRAA